MRITGAQAMQIARAVWGKDGRVRDGGTRRASTPEQRAAALAELRELRAKKIELPGFLDPKYADEMTLREFRALWRERKAALDAWRKREGELQSQCFRKRYDVGEVGMLAFHVKGSGDSWEIAFNEAGITSDRIEQILNPRRAAAKKAVARLEAQAGAE